MPGRPESQRANGATRPRRVLDRSLRATLARFVEAVVPHDQTDLELRAATVTSVLAYVGTLPRPVRIGVVTSLVAFEQGARLRSATRPRALSALAPEEADAYVRDLLAARTPIVRDAARLVRGLVVLCHYDLGPARARLGYDPDGHIAAVAQRRVERYGDEIRSVEAATAPAGGGAIEGPRESAAGSAADAPVRLTCDVVVVGSGAGGATTAAALADAGVDVVLVEEGEHRRTETFTTHVVPSLATLYRDGGAQTLVGSPPLTLLEGRCVGGSTVVNGGMCWRTPDHVLERWVRGERLSGITADELERHFRAVEERLCIGPQDAESMGGDTLALRVGAEALGWRTVRSRRNQLHCGGCDNCLNGCPTGAKRSMLVTNVPRAVARGARLVSGCRVERVTRDGRRATGVIGRFVGAAVPNGRWLQVRARVVVVAGGALQSPALLGRSGFRSRSRQLGRNLTVHPSVALVALFDEEVRGWQGVHQAFQVTEFAHDGILVTASTLPPALVAMNLPHHGTALGTLMRDYNRMVVAGCLIEDSGAGRVWRLPDGRPLGVYRVRAADAARLTRGLAHAADVMFAAGARRVLLPLAATPEPLSADAVRRVLATPLSPRALRPFTVHAMGTARMSDDPARGVVSSAGIFHGADGLLVSDASILPGPVAVNPMETIVALAARNAEQLIERRASHGI